VDRFGAAARSGDAVSPGVLALAHPRRTSQHVAKFDCLLPPRPTEFGLFIEITGT